jgi:hypothetical protein
VRHVKPQPDSCTRRGASVIVLEVLLLYLNILSAWLALTVVMNVI